MPGVTSPQPGTAGTGSRAGALVPPPTLPAPPPSWLRFLAASAARPEPALPPRAAATRHRRHSPARGPAGGCGGAAGGSPRVTGGRGDTGGHGDSSPVPAWHCHPSPHALWHRLWVGAQGDAFWGEKGLKWQSCPMLGEGLRWGGGALSRLTLAPCRGRWRCGPEHPPRLGVQEGGKVGGRGPAPPTAVPLTPRRRHRAGRVAGPRCRDKSAARTKGPDVRRGAGGHRATYFPPRQGGRQPRLGGTPRCCRCPPASFPPSPGPPSPGRVRPRRAPTHPRDGVGVTSGGGLPVGKLRQVPAARSGFLNQGGCVIKAPVNELMLGLQRGAGCGDRDGGLGTGGSGGTGGGEGPAAPPPALPAAARPHAHGHVRCCARVTHAVTPVVTRVGHGAVQVCMDSHAVGRGVSHGIVRVWPRGHA